MRLTPCKRLLSLFVQAIGTTQPDFFARRRGIMPPAVAVLGLMCMTSLGLRTGYEGLMVSMFASLGGALAWPDYPAASTFCRARKKITQAMFEAFREEVYRLAGPTVRTFMPRRRGFRVVAIDGSWISVPNSKLLRRLLGIHRIGPKRCPMGKPQVLLVVITDALTRMPIARVILPGNGSERAAAKILLKHLRRDDILVADRGYHGRDMLAAIHATGCRYVLRVPGGNSAWQEMRGFQRRRCRDALVVINHKKTSILARHLRISSGPGRPRRGSKRETMFLLTNLPASWSVKKVEAIYRARWGVETMFRELKSTLETNRLHARTLEGVVQELDACCLHLAIAAFLDMATINQHKDSAKSGPTKYQTNRSTLLLIVAIAFMTLDDDVLKRSGQAAITAARRAPLIRPGRHAPRKKRMFGKYGK